MGDLKNTTALGLDGIPVQVLKLGIETLAGPLSHLVNRSMASGSIPVSLKTGHIIPVYKGKGKAPDQPSSYRPISILPAVSKVLETVAKKDLETHLAVEGLLPNSQYGFRAARSTTAAVAAAHGRWVREAQRGRVLGILAFDFSAAFDTVDGERLVQRLEELGITGREAAWFRSYMEGGEQRTAWNGALSSPAAVRYGVRQGSILGPTLFLCLMSGLPAALEVSEEETVGYADDVTVWTSCDTVANLKIALESKAAALVKFASSNGLVLNPDKTQLLLVGATAAEKGSFSVSVDGVGVQPATQLELLGVMVDQRLSSLPQVEAAAKAARARASVIARLSAHLPPGKYLQTLASGLLIGKAGFSAAAAYKPHLLPDQPLTAAMRDMQVAINNAARAVFGIRRDAHVTTEKLLAEAGLPSINRLTIYLTALETWKAVHSCDGPGGKKNSLGSLLCSNPRRGPRAVDLLNPPLPIAADTFVYSAYLIWNNCPALREAKTLSAAKKAARSAASAAPL